MVSAALVARDGSIDWCCLPRFDSPSIFAAILDDEKGGKFGIEPRSHFESSQFYLNNTNVLQTVLQTGTVTLTDFMPCYRRVGRCSIRSAPGQAAYTRGLIQGKGW